MTTPATFPFLSFPVELQTAVLSHLPSSSLLQCSLTSHHLHSLAFPLLYKLVTISTPSSLSSFFLLPPSSPSSPPESYTARRSLELLLIKELRLDFPRLLNGEREIALPKSLGPLPRWLRTSLPSHLKLTTLRISYDHDRTLLTLLPLLLLLNPTKAYLYSPQHANPALFRTIPSIINQSWSRLTHLVLAQRDSSPFGRPKKMPSLNRQLESLEVNFLNSGANLYYRPKLVEDVASLVRSKGVKRTVRFRVGDAGEAVEGMVREVMGKQTEIKQSQVEVGRTLNIPFNRKRYTEEEGDCRREGETRWAGAGDVDGE